MSSLIMFVLYAAVVIIVALLGLKLFRQLSILDRPGKDWIPPRLFKVPNFQWIVLIAGFWIGLLLFFPDILLHSKIAWMLYLATGYGVFNFINDIIDRKGDMTGIAPLYRLIIQILFVSAYIYITWIYTNISFFGFELYPLFGFVFSLVWILGFINAINFFDGVNSMTAGVTSIGFVSIAVTIFYVVYVLYPDADRFLLDNVSLLCILFAISCLIYVVVEYKPSGVLRDCGLSFIGFVLGALSLLGGAKLGTMLLVLFLPICDSIRVFINRIIVMKKSPLKGDYTHLHHRLMKLGLTRNEIRWMVWWFTLTMLLLLILLGDGSIDKLILFVRLWVMFMISHVYMYWIKKMDFELIKREKKQLD